MLVLLIQVVVNNNSKKVDFKVKDDGGNTALIVYGSNGGVVVGAPTGGNKGAGTVNATAVYDDDSQLSDYVFEQSYQDTMYAIHEMKEFYTKHKRLPTIDGREAWKENGKPSLGKLTNQLWETIEVQAIYIAQLEERLSKLESDKE